ncbi:UbiX family flavin prenyltransferase [Amycolatopsis acidiphila]|uniref:Flavin prenyltransferase UbiX n=1 Tax=Amycolatopsis acidiphila TaxID=715473 RepID=A0A558AP07_9PSEU|nr:UbiX family flavin prenyltransferase [Amycolatopsis acidiphila]TVT26001.1 UbiX family flavin prenyltransferase [Amycolatopsis acidiphila]UIJ63284.1 UbiX family flavin prenyltransferase [Amycolatopsis acidiphila]GHG74789.1 flavin prenyltransferase UbiX [Amycolatopsis acidiphila]
MGLPKRLIVGIPGASGAIYGIRTLEVLRARADVETHLVISRSGRATIEYETGYSVQQVKNLADVVHSDHDLGSPISSGSFRTAGMLVAPCSVKTLSAVANCYDDTLLARAADVCLKERRPVVLLLRETPLHAGHVRLMSHCADAGAILMPPVPAFYTLPETVHDVVEHTVHRALDLFDLAPPETLRWTGERQAATAAVRRAV